MAIFFLRRLTIEYEKIKFKFTQSILTDFGSVTTNYIHSAKLWLLLTWLWITDYNDWIHSNFIMS